MISYMDIGIASSVYTKALDAEVENIKSDEKVRTQYMLLMEAYARERNMGKYITQVSQIRDSMDEFSTKQMSKYFKVKENACMNAIKCIMTHPDWDNEQVAEAIDWKE